MVIGGATADECLEDVWILAPTSTSDRPVPQPATHEPEPDDMDSHIYASTAAATPDAASALL